MGFETMLYETKLYVINNFIVIKNGMQSFIHKYCNFFSIFDNRESGR